MKNETFEDLVGNMTALAKNLRAIQKRGIAQYTPVVHQIIRTRSRDAQHIQHTLDHLLDYACLPEGLALFKTLCRYYWNIDPAATADYVNFYREMWDSDEKEEQP